MPFRNNSFVSSASSTLLRAVSGDAVGFAKADEFKGLENDAVTVADLPEPWLWKHDPISGCVAMSRPDSRARLPVVQGLL